jgi:heme O synthase-like polyprenyltransferase
MYREDYARGGIRMLPVVEPDGESTARRIVACSILLIPVSLLPRILGMTGYLYAGAAVAAGAGLVWSASWEGAILHQRPPCAACVCVLSADAVGRDGPR